MNRKQHPTTRIPKRAALLVLSLVMILCVTAGGTLAYLIMSTGDVTNTFEPGRVSTTIEENFHRPVKENVKVTNTGNVPVYIRAQIVVNWVDKAGNIWAETPTKDDDYTMDSPTDGWANGPGGFWYYKGEVAPNASTSYLIPQCAWNESKSPAEGYTLQVTILSQSIQATEAAVKDAWGEAALGYVK